MAGLAVSLAAGSEVSMSFRRLGMMVLVPMVVVQGSGCADTRCARCAPPPPSVVAAAPYPGTVQRNYAPVYPPPMVAAPLPQGSLPVNPPPVNNGYNPPAAAIQPQVTESRSGGQQPAVTETQPMPMPPRGAKLLAPEGPTAPKPIVPAEAQEEPKSKPAEPKPGATDFPADIPQFNLVYDQVAAGLQPFPEGFNWLKNHGYHTVLYVRAAGEDDTAVRTEVESKGMKYLTLEVSSQGLNRELVREFSRSITDSRDHPIFVFDRKGMMAGALWYLHFRLTESQGDADARSRAVRLGLKEDATGEYADLWLAINQLLR